MSIKYTFEQLLQLGCAPLSQQPLNETLPPEVRRVPVDPAAERSPLVTPTKPRQPLRATRKWIQRFQLEEVRPGMHQGEEDSASRPVFPDPEPDALDWESVALLPISQFPISDCRAAVLEQRDRTPTPPTPPPSEPQTAPLRETRSAPSVSVLGQHIEVLPFVELKPDTNLHLPPRNWLFNDQRLLRKHNVGLPSQNLPVNATEFASTPLLGSAGALVAFSGQGSTAPRGPNNVDFIATSECIRQLFSVPYSDAPLSMTIHKIGTSLVVEGDLLANSNGGVETGVKRSSKRSKAKALLSKFMYYSILAVDNDPAPAAPATAVPPRVECDTGGSMPQEAVNPEMGVPIPASKNAFSRTLHWKFRDLNLLLGSDAFVMRTPENNEAAVRLHDANEPLTQLTALEYWLDNVMVNVPHVAICYHREGFVQGYQLVSTQDLPGLSPETWFDPKVVEEYAGSVLAWLKEKCTKDAGSYLLVRDPESRALKLYDLSDLYGTSSAEDGHHAQPFAYPVGMMCYRMANRLLTSNSAQSVHCARKLLLTSVDLLDEHQEPVVVATAHEQIANSYLHIDPQPVKNQKPTKVASAKHEHNVARSGTLVPVDLRRESNHVAIEHLTKALQIFGRILVPDASRRAELLRMQHQSVRCYIDLAKVDAAKGALSDCLRWVSKAQMVLVLCERQQAADSANAEACAQLQLPPEWSRPKQGGVTHAEWEQTVAAGLAEVFGDFHAALARKPTEAAEVGGLLERLMADTQQTAKWSCLCSLAPLDPDPQANLRKAFLFYASAAAKLNGDSSGIKIKTGSTHCQLGRLYFEGFQFSRAMEQFQLALKAYTTVEYTPGIAEAYFLIAETTRGRAVITLEKTVADVPTEQEQSFVQSALRAYDQAVECGDAAIGRRAQLRMAELNLLLGKRLRQCFASLRASETDVERTVADVLLRADRHAEAVDEWTLAAEAAMELAQLYYVAQEMNHRSGGDHAPDRRTKLCELYWRKALQALQKRPDGAKCKMLHCLSGLCSLRLQMAREDARLGAKLTDAAIGELAAAVPLLAESAAQCEGNNHIREAMQKLLLVLLRSHKTDAKLRELYRRALTDGCSTETLSALTDLLSWRKQK
eukprot:TRINITY_DN886_c0_g1_i1.p1 TRINITY_DN886_c0_g1~~TRINITY_DN886_c0_g1_i1.p1  ORF type:complete len:1108 (+),score=174.93 TRINITY_DN886_c0_g1_i1:55-3378(+)